MLHTFTTEGGFLEQHFEGGTQTYQCVVNVIAMQKMLVAVDCTLMVHAMIHHRKYIADITNELQYR